MLFTEGADAFLNLMVEAWRYALIKGSVSCLIVQMVLCASSLYVLQTSWGLYSAYKGSLLFLIVPVSHTLHLCCGGALSLRIDKLWPLGQRSDVPLRDLFDVQFVVPHCSCLTHTTYVLRWGTFLSLVMVLIAGFFLRNVLFPCVYYEGPEYYWDFWVKGPLFDCILPYVSSPFPAFGGMLVASLLVFCLALLFYAVLRWAFSQRWWVEIIDMCHQPWECLDYLEFI